MGKGNRGSGGSAPSVEVRLSSEAGDTLRLRLDYSFSRFGPAEEQDFVGRVARIAQCSPSDITVTEKQRGCVIISLRFSSEAGRRLFLEEMQELRNRSARDLVRRYGIEIIEEVLAPNSRALQPPTVIRRRRGARFTWLHVSDLHANDGLGEGARKWNEDTVKQAFISSLQSNLDSNSLDLNAIFVTGDVSQSAQPGEYAEASRFFRAISDVVGEDVPLFVVPGNHDADWNALEVHLEAALVARTSSADEVNNLLLSDNPEETDRALSRFDGFGDFLAGVMPPQAEQTYAYSRYLGRSADASYPPGAWFTAKIPIAEDLTAGVVGLNSALFTRSKRAKERADFENLAIGEVPLTLAIDALRDTNFRIALSHHPIDSGWFTTTDRQFQRVFLRDVQFVLNGHEHDLTDLYRISSGMARGAVCIAAGALYQGRDRPNSYNVVDVDFNERTTRMYAWRFAQRGVPRWVPDTDQFDQGSGELPVPEEFYRDALTGGLRPKNLNRSGKASTDSARLIEKLRIASS